MNSTQNPTIAEFNKRKEVESSVAMTLLLISWGMFFATLFLAYFIIRSSSQIWPPMGQEKVSINLPTLSTFIIALSSWALEIFRSSYLKNCNSKKHFLSISIGLGIGFLIAQFNLWNMLAAKGYFVETGVFTSILYGFTWIHAAHMVFGLLGLVSLFYWLKRPNVGANQLVLKNVSIFWHFLGVIWLLMYITLFLI